MPPTITSSCFGMAIHFSRKDGIRAIGGRRAPAVLRTGTGKRSLYQASMLLPFYRKKKVDRITSSGLSLLSNYHHRPTFQPRSFVSMFSTSEKTFASQPPAEIVQTAIESLQEFSNKLKHLAAQVDVPHSIIITNDQSNSNDEDNNDNNNNKNSTIKISVAEMALHSRDAPMNDEFQSDRTQLIRQSILKPAQEIEATLWALVKEYTEVIQPQMEAATQVCKETPCGGASWELDMNQLLQKTQKEKTTNISDESMTQRNSQNDGTHRVVLEGDHGTLDGTPCGRLQLQSLRFLEKTRETKFQTLMASRARILIELVMLPSPSPSSNPIKNKGLSTESMLNGAPLQHIRRRGTNEQNKYIRAIFRSQTVPTPWIRTDAEYENLRNVQEELSV